MTYSSVNPFQTAHQINGSNYCLDNSGGDDNGCGGGTGKGVTTALYLTGGGRGAGTTDADSYSSGYGEGHGWGNGDGDWDGVGISDDNAGFDNGGGLGIGRDPTIGFPPSVAAQIDPSGNIWDSERILHAYAYMNATSQEEKDSILGLLELTKEHT